MKYLSTLSSSTNMHNNNKYHPHHHYDQEHHLLLSGGSKVSFICNAVVAHFIYKICSQFLYNVHKTCQILHEIYHDVDRDDRKRNIQPTTSQHSTHQTTHNNLLSSPLLIPNIYYHALLIGNRNAMILSNKNQQTMILGRYCKVCKDLYRQTYILQKYILYDLICIAKYSDIIC